MVHLSGAAGVEPDVGIEAQSRPAFAHGVLRETTTVTPHAYGPPADLRTLKGDIASRRAVLPGQFEKIGRHALANPEEIAFGTSRQIAASVGASQSTVSRFVRALGFEEFSQFRASFRSYLRDRKSRT